MARATSKPFLKSFCFAAIAFPAGLAVIFLSLGAPASPEGAGEVIGRILIWASFPALITGLWARFSGSPWSLLRIGLTYFIILVLVVLLSVAGRTNQQDIQARNVQTVQFINQGKYAEAFKLAEQTLALAEKTLGPEHPLTLQSVNNLGGLYNEQGRYSEAESLYERASAGREKALGPEHPDTLVSVNNLGMLYQKQGHYSEAEPLLKRALAGNENALGPEHPNTLGSVNNLGLLYERQGRYSEAEPFYQRALAGYERRWGRSIP